jgi:hypothetical protein
VDSNHGSRSFGRRANRSPPPSTSAELDTRYAVALTKLAGEDAKELYETGVDGSP